LISARASTINATIKRKDTLMSKAIAIAAGAITFAVVGGTFVLTWAGGQPDPCAAVAVGGRIGGPFTLINAGGARVTDVDVITEPTLVYFGYTFCPDVCPLDVARNAAAVDILAEQGVSATPLFITIDPARDTAAILRDYTDNFHPKMIGLTGSDAQIAAASRAYGTFYQKQGDDRDYYLMQHSTFTYLMLPQTGFADLFRRDATPAQVAERTACLVAASRLVDG